MLNLLNLISGDAVARGAASLPDAKKARAELIDKAVDSGWAGWVLITYERRRYTLGRSVKWAWVAVSASAIEEDTQPGCHRPAAAPRSLEL